MNIAKYNKKKYSVRYNYVPCTYLILDTISIERESFDFKLDESREPEVYYQETQVYIIQNQLKNFTKINHCFEVWSSIVFWL